MMLIPGRRSQTRTQRVRRESPSGCKCQILSTRFQHWQSVVAVVRPFRWKPIFRKTGYERGADPDPPGPFFRDARIFFELLAVADATPLLRLAELSCCIDRSAGRLLGRERHGPGFYQSWAANGFDGFTECPALAPEALTEAEEAFGNRNSGRYVQLAPIVGRLAEALARVGPFAAHYKIVEVGIALESMYDLPQRNISRTLRNRVSRYLGKDSEPSQHQGERQGVLRRTFGYRSQPAGEADSAGKL